MAEQGYGYMSVPPSKGKNYMKGGNILATNTNTANEQLNKFDYYLDFNSTGSVRDNSLTNQHKKNM